MSTLGTTHPTALLERLRARVVTTSAEAGVVIYDHEVWNDTGGQRVVLFLDVVRPLTGVARHLNAALLWLIAHSPLIRDARRRQARWTAAVAARRAATPGA
jgi:hypothetical protein